MNQYRKRKVGHKRSSSLLEKIQIRDVKFNMGSSNTNELDQSKQSVNHSSDFGTTQMYLAEIEQKAKKNKQKIKKEELNLKQNPVCKAKQKLKLMRKLKPTRKDIDIYSTDSDS